MYTKKEMEAANLLGINPKHIKGYEDDPELKEFIPELVALRKNDAIINEAMSKPLPLDDKSPEEVLREVRLEVWEETLRAEGE